MVFATARPCVIQRGVHDRASAEGAKVHSKRKPIVTSRAVNIYRETISLRDGYAGAHEFFRMPELWEYVSDDDLVRVRTYASRPNEITRRKASAIRFGDRVTLIVDEDYWARARLGENFPNFTLAHEFCHVGLDHHTNGAGVKNFQLTARQADFANIPPNEEEFEANFAAVVLQCGNALLASHVDPRNLAKRAFSDYLWVEKVVQFCRLEAFQRELNRPRPVYPRVIL